MALPQRPDDLSLPMAPFHDLFGSERPLHLDSRPASRRLDQVSFHFRLDYRGTSSLPTHSTSYRELAEKLGCSNALAGNLSTSGFRKSSILPLPLVESKDLDDQSASNRAEGLDAGDLYDVTPAALVAAGSLPEIRVDGPFGAPTQDVFNAEGERQELPLSGSDNRGALSVQELPQSPSLSPPVSASPRSPRSSRTSGALDLSHRSRVPTTSDGVTFRFNAESKVIFRQVHAAAESSRRASSRTPRLDRQRHGKHGLVDRAPAPTRAGEGVFRHRALIALPS